MQGCGLEESWEERKASNIAEKQQHLPGHLVWGQGVTEELRAPNRASACPMAQMPLMTPMAQLPPSDMPLCAGALMLCACLSHTPQASRQDQVGWAMAASKTTTAPREGDQCRPEGTDAQNTRTALAPNRTDMQACYTNLKLPWLVQQGKPRCYFDPV